MNKVGYPFTAIVGQEKAKKALLLNLICPQIGGALLSGQKGTAKSTLIRSLEQLMVDIKVKTIPLSATEDRVVGTVNIEEALLNGKQVYEPGILAEAHENILYIDEVNLLPDSIVSTVLDAASMAVNNIEREGLSYSHSCEFILFGSMNPEEGDMKPQILDRFGFFAELTGSMNKEERIEIIKRRIAYEENPIEFNKQFEKEDKELVKKVDIAKKMFKEVVISDDLIELIAKLNLEAFAAGHRGDIALTLGAMANAAFNRRKNVNLEDVKELADLALPHRFRNPPQDFKDTTPEENEECPEDQPDNQSETHEDGDTQEQEQTEELLPEVSEDLSEEIDNESNEGRGEEENTSQEEQFEIGDVFKVRDILGDAFSKRMTSGGCGRRNKTVSSTRIGRYIRYRIPKGKVTDVAFDATLRSAAPYQNSRERGDLFISIKREDIREKVREKRVGSTIIFLVDASGSMGVERRMVEAKGAILSLLKDAYQNRDSVGMMTFRGNNAEMILSPTRSIDLAYKKLGDIKVGGKTPLALGIKSSVDLIRGLKAKKSDIQPILIIISDGRGNVPLTEKNLIEEIQGISIDASREKIKFMVIDTETGFLKLELAKKMAENLNATYFKLDEMRDGELAEKIKVYTN